MIGFRLVCVCLVLGLAGEALGQEPAALEKRMAERPAEAFALLRAAADTLSPKQFQELLAKAARLQEERLALLSENQLEDLAGVYASRLNEAEAASRVQRRWLQLRRQALDPTDAAGRLALARLAWRWVRDRDIAASLCQEALRLAPELAAAEKMLQEDLRYARTDKGWLPREQLTPTDRRNMGRVRIGMTPVEVRSLVGPPDRIARQILFGRYLEQWIYDGQPRTWVEFECRRGEEPHVHTSHSSEAIKDPVPPPSN